MSGESLRQKGTNTLWLEITQEVLCMPLCYVHSFLFHSSPSGKTVFYCFLVYIGKTTAVNSTLVYIQLLHTEVTRMYLDNRIS